MATKRYGGSFAPPITEDKLEEYRQMSANVEDRRCSDYMIELVEMLDLFFETNESQLPGSKHPSGVGTIVPLEPSEVERIWDKVPYAEECNVMSDAFDKLTGDQRNAAYHLLWYARELTQDREPITQDKL